MAEELYYSAPTQVRFLIDKDHYEYGIALYDFIIDGRNGEKLNIGDIWNIANAYGINEDDAIIELDWLNISYSIKGEKK